MPKLRVHNFSISLDGYGALVKPESRQSFSGEHFFAGLDLRALGYRCTEHVASKSAIHAVLKKTSL